MLIPKSLTAVGRSRLLSSAVGSNLNNLGVPPFGSTIFRAASTLPPWGTLQHAGNLNAMALTGAAKPLLDFARVKTRLDGLHSYGVIATLLMNAGLRLYSSTPKRTDDGGPTLENVTKFIFTMAMLLSVVTGSYTTIVFALLDMYSKRALGLGMDEKFLQFFDATQKIRETAFDSFVVCLGTFQMSFCLSLFLNYRGKFRWVLLAVAAILSCMAWYQWSKIMHLATVLLFTGRM